MSDNIPPAGFLPLYSPQEQIIVDLVGAIPAGHVTSQLTIAAKIYGEKIPRNAGSNISKSLNNLEGRSTIPQHRVLRSSRGNAGNSPRYQVREAHHVALLAAEGVEIDGRGRLGNQNAVWDFSEKCERAYIAKVAATAPDAASPGNLALSAVSDDTAVPRTFSQDVDIAVAENAVAENEMDYIAEQLDAALNALNRQDHFA